MMAANNRTGSDARNTLGAQPWPQKAAPKPVVWAGRLESSLSVVTTSVNILLEGEVSFNGADMVTRSRTPERGTPRG